MLSDERETNGPQNFEWSSIERLCAVISVRFKEPAFDTSLKTSEVLISYNPNDDLARLLSSLLAIKSAVNEVVYAHYVGFHRSISKYADIVHVFDHIQQIVMSMSSSFTTARGCLRCEKGSFIEHTRAWVETITLQDLNYRLLEVLSVTCFPERTRFFLSGGHYLPAVVLAVETNSIFADLCFHRSGSVLQNIFQEYSTHAKAICKAVSAELTSAVFLGHIKNTCSSSYHLSLFTKVQPRKSQWGDMLIACSSGKELITFFGRLMGYLADGAGHETLKIFHRELLQCCHRNLLIDFFASKVFAHQVNCVRLGQYHLVLQSVLEHILNSYQVILANIGQVNDLRREVVQFNFISNEFHQNIWIDVARVVVDALSKTLDRTVMNLSGCTLSNIFRWEICDFEYGLNSAFSKSGNGQRLCLFRDADELRSFTFQWNRGRKTMCETEKSKKPYHVDLCKKSSGFQAKTMVCHLAEVTRAAQRLQRTLGLPDSRTRGIFDEYLAWTILVKTSQRLTCDA
eukprot:30940-Pelagococcus_subviridis.AAC.3